MPKFAAGQSIPRIEDDSLLRGAGRYCDDFHLARAAHAYFVRSPHAHAKIVRIDAWAARTASGVVAVLTGEDAAADGLGEIPCLIPVTNLDGTARADTPRPVLARGRVRHAGDPVAVVIAETLALAKDAAERMEIEYQPLPAVADTRAAMQPGAPRAWDHIPGNIAFEIGLGESKGAVEAAFAKAAHVTRLELVNNRLVANPMEPRAALAEHDPASGRTTLVTPSQGPHHLHGQIADAVLRIGREKLRVISGNVGGAFGMKIFLYPEQPVVAWAARRLGRAVRWTAERGESFLSDAQGRDHYSIAELATDREGRFLALRVTIWANMGAYLSNFGPFIPQLAAPMLSGVYRIPAIWLHLKGVVTNTVPVDAYRGAGRPEAIYLLERTIDVAARELGLAPQELRRRNFVAPADMPYQTSVESRYDSGEFAAIMERAMQNAQWAEFPARREEAQRRGRLRGIGLAMYIERCGGGPGDTVALKVDPAGTVTLFSGMQDNGQGHATTFVQLLSERLGIDTSRIRVVQGDTDLVPPEGLTGGSRFLAIGGIAAQSAAGEVIEKGRQAAAKQLEVAAVDVEYGEGEFRVAGTDRRLSLFDAARAAGGKLEATHTRAPEASTYPNGCHLCEVEIDPDTGETRIVRYTVVDDFGRAINPLLLEGQVHGGTVQGIGQALLEHAVYDPESAQLLTGSFMDYAMPRADDVPSLDCAFHHVPCTSNPLGVKGAGEAGAVGAPAAVVNAIVDALYPQTGLKHLDMPLTREKVWRALEARKR
ncbi:MAG: xanthine dehydrogenase family protein molybdopterin-binding subunit [Betaproteobacteria bacterium]|nr:xanthine dehydrogenase family protein molybdopterin-binding subunit [Betaproteobacteria bacterium]